MDFALTEEQQAIRETFHRFAAQEIRPTAADLDANPRFPHEIFKRAGEMGFFGMRYPAPFGSGLDVQSYLLAVEELSWGNLAVAAACTMHSLMGTFFLHRFGDEALQQRLLVPALRGDLISTICMTEPDAGSDLGSITTKAVRDGESWLISGSKTFITSAPVADFFTVFARTGERELSWLLVEKGAEGLHVGRSIDKMGVKASLTSEVFFDNTPATCLFGEPGMGMGCLREILAEIRLMTAALSLGVARAAFEDARAYADERQQFGRPIRKFQAVGHHLAEMAVDLQASRQLIQWGAWRSEQGLENATEASMAKLFASEAGHRICDRAARILASYGYATDHAIERYLRDIRFTLIGGGTSEILRVNIARGLF